MKNSLYIINNEKCFRNNGKTFCENIEIKLLAEDLKKYFNLKLILRRSKRQSVHEINNSQISILNTQAEMSKIQHKISRSDRFPS